MKSENLDPTVLFRTEKITDEEKKIPEKKILIPSISEKKKGKNKTKKERKKSLM